MNPVTLDTLAALTRPKGFIYQDEIPGEHYEAFWTFTGSQTVFKGPNGRPAIPALRGTSTLPGFERNLRSRVRPRRRRRPNGANELGAGSSAGRSRRDRCQVTHPSPWDASTLEI